MKDSETVGKDSEGVGKDLERVALYSVCLPTL